MADSIFVATALTSSNFMPPSLGQCQVEDGHTHRT